MAFIDRNPWVQTPSGFDAINAILLHPSCPWYNCYIHPHNILTFIAIIYLTCHKSCARLLISWCWRINNRKLQYFFSCLPWILVSGAMVLMGNDSLRKTAKKHVNHSIVVAVVHVKESKIGWVSYYYNYIDEKWTHAYLYIDRFLAVMHTLLIMLSHRLWGEQLYNLWLNMQMIMHNGMLEVRGKSFHWHYSNFREKTFTWGWLSNPKIFLHWSLKIPPPPSPLAIQYFWVYGLLHLCQIFQILSWEWGDPV